MLDNGISFKRFIFTYSLYMFFVGSHFGMGIGKTLMIIFSGIIGLFIGIHRKIVSSSMIFIFIFLGSLFSKGNGKIYTVIFGFIIGLYISKQISKIFNKKYKNRFIKFIF